MGLFSKHKSSNSNMPPAPPSASLNSVKESQGSSMSDLVAPPMSSDMSRGSNLSPPPILGGNGLDDIKEQVSSSNSNSGMNNQASGFNEQDNNNSSFDSSSDSLFDDMFNTDEMHDENSQNLALKENSQQNKSFSNDSSAFDIGDFDNNSYDPVDTNMDRNDSLGFVRGGNYNSHSGKDSCFLTTSQFKTLLEIVESVKTKVKDSTETHLRLMDIKSEEDIEYENLRKNFAQMEDKLYELDTVLFEENK